MADVPATMTPDDSNPKPLPAASTMPADSAVAPAPREPGALSRLAKYGGWIIGAGTAAELLGKTVNGVDKIRHFLFDTLGVRLFSSLHLALVVSVGALLILGYVAAATWSYIRLKSYPLRMRIGFATIAAIGLCSMAYANYLLVPAGPDLQKYLRQEREEWSERALTRDPADGGVPVSTFDPSSRSQVWTTAQVLTGVLSGAAPVDAVRARRIRRAFEYMEHVRLQNRLGGWGYFEEWPWSVTEISAWVVLAEVASLKHQNIWPTEEDRRVVRERVMRDIASVLVAQQEDGSWAPIVGRVPGLGRTYSTAMAVWCLLEAHRSPEMASVATGYGTQIRDGFSWLLNRFSATNAREDHLPLGWVPNPFRANQQETVIGLNAQVLFVVQAVTQTPGFQDLRSHPQFLAAIDAFLARENQLASVDIAHNHRLHDSDRYLPQASATISVGNDESVCSCPVTIEGSTFLWYPWSFAAAKNLSVDSTLSEDRQKAAARIADRLLGRLSESAEFVSKELNYVTGEFLVCLLPARIRGLTDAPLSR